MSVVAVGTMDKQDVLLHMELENRARFSKELDDLLRKYRIPESAVLTVKIIKLIYGDE